MHLGNLLVLQICEFDGSFEFVNFVNLYYFADLLSFWVFWFVVCILMIWNDIRWSLLVLVDWFSILVGLVFAFSAELSWFLFGYSCDVIVLVLYFMVLIIHLFGLLYLVNLILAICVNLTCVLFGFTWMFYFVVWFVVCYTEFVNLLRCGASWLLVVLFGFACCLVVLMCLFVYVGFGYYLISYCLLFVWLRCVVWGMFFDVNLDGFVILLDVD